MTKRLGLNDDERKLDACKALLGEPADEVVGKLLDTISLLRLEVADHLAAIAREREQVDAVLRDLCSCGGAGPGEGCVVCEARHEIQRLRETDIPSATPSAVKDFVDQVDERRREQG